MADALPVTIATATGATKEEEAAVATLVTVLRDIAATFMVIACDPESGVKLQNKADAAFEARHRLL